MASVPKLNSFRFDDVRKFASGLSAFVASAKSSHHNVAPNGTTTAAAIQANSVFHAPFLASHSRVAAQIPAGNR